MSIKSNLTKLKQWRRILLLLLIAATFSTVCYWLGQVLFPSYYSAQWGLSSIGMHSPPFGSNYPKKASIVGFYSILVSFPFGLYFTWLFIGNKKLK